MFTVGDVMTKAVVSVSTEDSVAQVRETLAHAQVGVAPVLDESGGLTGIVSVADVVNAFDCQVTRVMSTEPFTLVADSKVLDAAKEMLDRDIHHIVVMEKGNIAGIVSSFDLLRVLVGEAREASTGATRRTNPQAHVGDRIVIRGHSVVEPERKGVITETKGADGGPPFMVQWLDDPNSTPHEVLFFPGSDAEIEPPVS